MLRGEATIQQHLARQCLTMFDGRLIEGIHAEQVCSQDGFQHVMHHQCAHAALVNSIH